MVFDNTSHHNSSKTIFFTNNKQQQIRNVISYKYKIKIKIFIDFVKFSIFKSTYKDFNFCEKLKKTEKKFEVSKYSQKSIVYTLLNTPLNTP